MDAVLPHQTAEDGDPTPRSATAASARPSALGETEPAPAEDLNQLVLLALQSVEDQARDLAELKATQATQSAQLAAIGQTAVALLELVRDFHQRVQPLVELAGKFGRRRGSQRT